MIILTDHKNLTQFTITKELNKQQIQWAEILNKYCLSIQYNLGRDNQTTDALNRRSDYITKQTRTDHAIFKQESDEVLQINILIIMTNDKDAQTNDFKIRITNEKNIEKVIKAHHKSKKIEHSEINKTIQLIQRNFIIYELKK